jgi:hypothetical protein
VARPADAGRALAVRGPVALRALVVVPVLPLGFDHSEIRPPLLVLLLNPYGFHVYTLFYEISANVQTIGEWLPHAPDTWQFLLLVGLVGAASVGIVKTSTRVQP